MQSELFYTATIEGPGRERLTAHFVFPPSRDDLLFAIQAAHDALQTIIDAEGTDYIEKDVFGEQQHDLERLTEVVSLAEPPVAPITEGTAGLNVKVAGVTIGHIEIEGRTIFRRIPELSAALKKAFKNARTKGLKVAA